MKSLRIDYITNGSLDFNMDGLLSLEKKKNE
jgi:hypothetical protein